MNQFSGGWSGMNHHIYNQLKQQFNIHVVDEINPPFFTRERIASKLYRMAGLKGLFPAFTPRRLNKINSLVASKIDTSAALNFFHGATPWLHVRTGIPYAMYLDACFASYINVYHNSSDFDAKQLEDIFLKEASFLKMAEAVFFSSGWALNEAKKHYNLKDNNLYVAGLGGALKDDVKRNTSAPPYFLFMGLDFLGKGGAEVIEAFKEVQESFPHFKLKIVGQKPADKYLNNTNVEYLGVIDKAAPGGLKRITEIFANAYCFVMPTNKDMTPLVLVEAGSVGCPVISTRSFGIPEIVKQNETGILIDTEKPVIRQLVEAMKEICNDQYLHEKMSLAAKQHISANFSWTRCGEIIRSSLTSSKLNL